MNAPDVDLSQIRGDWFFHMNFLTNAIDRTLERQGKLRGEISDDAIGKLLDRQHEIWRELTGKKDDTGAFPTDDALVQQFIDVSKETKDACDAFEAQHGLTGSNYITDSAREQCTEACRQVRSLCEDLIMMRDQDPRT